MITPQQKRTLELASFGLSVSEIADFMGISVRTVEHHLSEARERLESKNTTHAVASAIRLNIIKCILMILCINDVSMDQMATMRTPSRTRTTNTIRIARNLQIKTGRQRS